MNVPIGHFATSRSLCFLVALSLVGASTALQAQTAANAVQFVSTSGSDSSTGLSWASAVADIPTAYNNLPSCTIPAQSNIGQGSQTWSHCGFIHVGAGTFTPASTISISGPVFIMGQGANATIFQPTSGLTSGCVFSLTANPFNASQPGDNFGGLFDMTILGPSTPVSGICGLKTYDMIGFRSAKLVIAGFTGANNMGWLDETVNYWNERFNIEMTIQNNTYDWYVQNAKTTEGTTFGYGTFDLNMNANAGQTAIYSTGNSANYVGMHVSLMHIIINLASTGQCGSLNNYSKWTVTGVVHCEQSGGSGQTGFATDAHSFLQVSGSYDSPGPDRGNVAVMQWTGDGVSAPSYELFSLASNANFGVQNYTPATSRTAQSSPSLYLAGRCYHAGASAVRAWGISDNENNGTDGNSILTVTPSSVCGGAAFFGLAPGVQFSMQPSSGGGSLNFNLASGTYTSYPTVSFPPLAGKAGVNGQATNGFYVAVRGVAGCTTDYAMPPYSCDTPITVTWPTPFADTNYATVCSPSGPAGAAGVPSAPFVASKSSGSITVNYYGNGITTTSWQTIDCVAVHD